MVFRESTNSDSQAIVQLITSAFTDAEGETEGILIGRLARDLIERTDALDLFGFVAEEKNQILGSIFFSRILIGNINEAFILAPVAVHGDHHNKGIGQTLIKHGLSRLKDKGVRFVLCYGDPAFYKKVGFQPISVEVIKPPFELSQPHGWIGQSLGEDPIETLSGSSACVEALNDPAYW